jgi:hypothetical protein
MNASGRMFEEGVKQALKLLQNPQAREDLREALAKSAGAVSKIGKKILEQTAKRGRLAKIISLGVARS